MKRHPHRPHGRDVARLLTDFGHQPPSIAPEAGVVREPRVFPGTAPGRGTAARDRGWMPAKAQVRVYRMPSDQAAVFWPFIHSPGLPPTGVQVGVDERSGGVFCCDPLGWVLNPDLPVSNPNIFVAGKPGEGKSGTVKAILNRFLGYHYRALICGDPKDEYESLCRAWDVEPFAIGHGMPTRINPLALGPLGESLNRVDAAEAQSRVQVVFARWQTLVRGLVGSMKIGEANVGFGPSEAAVVKLALEDLTGYVDGATTLRETTIPQLWRLLDDPQPDLIARCRYPTKQAFFDDTRLLRDALGQLVTGPLRGLFDQPTNIRVDWDAPIQSLSLSRLNKLGDEAVGIALMCLNSWAQGMREAATRNDPWVIVRDESWRQMRLGVEAVKAFDAALRLSRGVGGEAGDIQIAVMHKPSDLRTAGAAGSQADAIAKDLLALADIKILHGQDAQVGGELAGMLDLSPQGQHLVTSWAREERGRALWVVGGAEYKVRTILHPLERELFETNTGINQAA